MRGHCGQQPRIGEHAGTEDRVVARRAIRHRRPGYREEQSRGPADHAARQGFWVAHGAEAPNVCRLPRPEGRHASHERAAAAPEQRDIPEPAQCLTGTGRRAQRRVVGSRVGGHGCREHGHQERLGDPTDAMRSWGGRPRERGVARRQGGIRKAWGGGGARHTGTLVALLVRRCSTWRDLLAPSGCCAQDPDHPRVPFRRGQSDLSTGSECPFDGVRVSFRRGWGGAAARAGGRFSRAGAPRRRPRGRPRAGRCCAPGRHWSAATRRR